MMNWGQMCVCIISQYADAEEFPALKPLRWRVENSTLTTVKCGVKERGVTCDRPQLSASAFLKEFWCVVHRL